MPKKYNFDEIIDRKGSNSVKWDSAEDKDVLPMWVADMDFKTAPEITDVLLRKISQGVLGYNTLPENFYQSVIDWWKNSHGASIEKGWILEGPGMIPTLSAVARTFLQPGENIIIQPPVYNHFYTIIDSCRFNLIENNLIYKNGNYEIDFDDLELKASDPKTKLLLLCNPHNPVGRVFKQQELERIAEICSRYNVFVISDEIHSDLVFKGHQHIPFFSVAEKYDLNSVTCGSPCKTFNLAGLPISYVISDDRKILNQIQKTFEIQETNYPNPLAAEALVAAYSYGRAWVDELKHYIFENYSHLITFCNNHLPHIKVTPLQATYLVWIDCRFYNKTSAKLSEYLIEEGKLWLNPGTMYGKAGEGFLRINIGCPKEVLIDGLNRLKDALNQLD